MFSCKYITKLCITQWHKLKNHDIWISNCSLNSGVFPDQLKINWVFLLFFFTKAVPVQGITDIALLGFSLSLLTGMFISYNTIVYFFGKILFSNIYISVCLMFEYFYLSFGWEIGHPWSIYVITRTKVGHPKCLQMRTGGEGYHASCVRTHISFHVFVLWCLDLFVKI